MNVFILLTPFHIWQLKKVSTQFSIDMSNSLFLFPSTISKDNVLEVLELKKITYLEIPSFTILLKDILKNPFSAIPKYQNYIKIFHLFIKENIEPLLNNKIELFIGSEKYIFTQIFISYLIKENRLLYLSALEEGLGYYKETTWKDKLLSLVYPILTPLLFKQKLHYFSQLGVHKSISTVYARFPEYIPNKRKNVKYVTIEKENYKEILQKLTTINYLIFTSPLSEYKICSIHDEQKVLSIVLNTLYSHKVNFTIKPHPYESINKFNYFKKQTLNVLNPKQTGEKLNYSDYSHVIHFGSSIILDLYSKGISLKNIITIDPLFFKSSLTDKLFSEGRHLQFYSDNLAIEFDKSIVEITKNEN